MISLVNLVPGSQLTTGQVSYYSPLNVAAKILNATLYNSTGGAITCSVWIVPTGGSVSSRYEVLSRSIGAGETYNCPELVAKNIENGGNLYAQAGSNTSVSLLVSGIEYSSGAA